MFPEVYQVKSQIRHLRHKISGVFIVYSLSTSIIFHKSTRKRTKTQRFKPADPRGPPCPQDSFKIMQFSGKKREKTILSKLWTLGPPSGVKTPKIVQATTVLNSVKLQFVVDLLFLSKLKLKVYFRQTLVSFDHFCLLFCFCSCWVSSSSYFSVKTLSKPPSTTGNKTLVRLSRCSDGRVPSELSPLLSSSSFSVLSANISACMRMAMASDSCASSMSFFCSSSLFSRIFS